MSVRVEEEWRFKRVRSERASRSAFAYKINKRLYVKNQSKSSYGAEALKPYSREVILKITGGARSQKGIANSLHYISKEGQLELTDSNGVQYKTRQDIQDAVQLMQSHVVSHTESDKGAEKLTHNFVFSASLVAGVRKDDLQQAAHQAIQQKYPNNYFVSAYHEDTKKPHVHVILNIHQNDGKKIDIKNKDFHELRRAFCQRLVEGGYDVKASRRYEEGPYSLKVEDHEVLKRENRNVYQVVEFGSESYQGDKRNSDNYYLIYQTENNREVTIWGKELFSEVSENNIQKGDLIKIKKTGHTTVKVPVYGDDHKTILSWRETKRNQWQIEKVGDGFGVNSFEQDIQNPKEIKLDTDVQAEKQWLQRQKFEEEKKIFLGFSPERQLKFESELRYKPPSHSF